MDNKIFADDIYAPAFTVKLVNSNETIPRNEITGIEIDEELESPGLFKISFNEYLDPDTQKFKWLDNESIAPGTKLLIYSGTSLLIPKEFLEVELKPYLQVFLQVELLHSVRKGLIFLTTFKKRRLK